jgi:hypothetical protein
MVHLSESGPAGTGIRACILPDQDLHGGLALGLASLAGLAGGGDTGDTIGTTTAFYSTTTPTYPAAEFSSIASTSTLREADSIMVDFVEPAAFMAEKEGSHRTRRLALIPAPSAALIVEERREASLPEDGRALAAAFMGVEASTAEAVFTAVAAEGNRVQLQLMMMEK